MEHMIYLSKRNYYKMSFIYIVQSFLNEVLTFFYFPIWWYTKGIFVAFKGMKEAFVIGNRNLAVTLWIKNWFVPMFGQHDWQGRIISVFIRTVQIIIRSILFVLWSIVVVFGFLLWVFGPLICIVEIIRRLFI